VLSRGENQYVFRTVSVGVISKSKFNEVLDFGKGKYALISYKNATALFSFPQFAHSSGTRWNLIPEFEGSTAYDLGIAYRR